MKPSDFAIGVPLRASMLNTLMKCGGFAVFDMEDNRPVGPAAHTGTAVGRAIELYHRGAENEEAMNQVRREAVSGSGGDPFPLARWDEVRSMLTSYTDDDRNARSAVVTHSLEEEVTLTLPPHPSDSTKADITIVGHVDQVRFEDGTYSVWDLKSGRAQGKDMLALYLWQQVVYTLAYKAKYPERRVKWGGIIRLRGYLQQKRVANPKYDPSKKSSSKQKLAPYPASFAPVFFHAPYRKDDLNFVADQIRLRIARIRNGEIILTPGEHCGWCSRSGVSDCYPDLQERGFNV